MNLEELKLPKPTPLTYHYTCHLRGLGVKDDAVKLLRQLGNVQFKPLERTDQCCGFGGTFAVKYPAISQAMVEDKVACIERSEAAVTVCNDAGCTMNIAGMCHKKGVKTQVKHIAEVLAEAMGLGVSIWAWDCAYARAWPFGPTGRVTTGSVRMEVFAGRIHWGE